MNISPLPYITLQGGNEKNSRASRAFLSYFNNIWEIAPPLLENFLDPPLLIDYYFLHKSIYFS